MKTFLLLLLLVSSASCQVDCDATTETVLDTDTTAPPSGTTAPLVVTTARPATTGFPTEVNTDGTTTLLTAAPFKDVAPCGSTTSKPKSCLPGWYQFSRPSGPWCMQIFRAGASAGYDATTANCKTKGALLSGIQDPYEMTTMLNAGALKNITGSVWIGAKRTAACTGKKLSTACSQKTAFAWSDNGGTTGTDGFTWLDSSQPDNAHGSTQNCIVAFFAQGNVVYKGVTWRPAAMDDVACDASQFAKTGPRVVSGFICGMRPT